MSTKTKNQELQLFIILSSVFIASLVSCNLIFQKFFSINIWLPFIGDYTFEQSVGLLAYPVTFLVTDIISEIYGRKRANQVVASGLIASLFMLLLVMVSDSIQSAPFGTGNIFAYPPSSPDMIEEIKVKEDFIMNLSNKEDCEAGGYYWQSSSVPTEPEYCSGFKKDNTFSIVFGLSSAAVFASMVAYLFAQFIDVRLFHFWKSLTKGKHLWLRNNASTVYSQCIDTLLVLFLLCYFNVIPWEKFGPYFINGFLFKIFFAAFDTPFFYLFSNILKKKFGLKLNEEVSF